MEKQIYESVKFILDKFGIGMNEAIDAFSRWAIAEVGICLILGILAGISLFILIKILPKCLRDKDEVTRSLSYITGITIFLILGILFFDQLFIAIKAIASPKAYAIKKLFELIPCK